MLQMRRTNMERKSLRPVHGVPWVLSNFIHSNTLRWVRLEDTVDHVLCLRRQKLGESVVCIKDLSIQVGCLLILEWKVSTEHSV